jgi:hypothetical protein
MQWLCEPPLGEHLPPLVLSWQIGTSTRAGASRGSRMALQILSFAHWSGYGRRA